MKLVSDLLDGLVVYLSTISYFATPDLGELLSKHGAIVALNINARVRNIWHK